MKKIRKAQAAKVVNTIVSPVENFMKLETSSGILLVLVTLVALIWANSPWHVSYEHFIEYPFAFGFGDILLKNLFITGSMMDLW